MASIAETDHTPAETREGFRPSMLLNDSRYRSITIQVIALALLIAGFVWLGYNAKVNLEALGKEIRWDFLWAPSSYDIDLTLIDYTSRSPHWKAALVGILNTFLVAIMGVVTATILGVFAGVARLSNNWLVARLMTVYVEIFRNVPLLIWILLAIALFVEVFPAPRQAWSLPGDAVVFTNRGIYFTMPDWQDGSWMVALTALVGLVLAYLYRRHAKKKQAETGELLPWVKVGLVLIVVPAVIVFFLTGMPIGLDQPELRGFNYGGGFRMAGSLFALWIGLSVYTGAFIAEVVRGGIQSVSSGQREAALALGLQPRRIMNLVILPQALRVIIPPLISQYLNLIKNSSLAIATGYYDVTGTLGGVTLNQTGREMECLLLLMAFYLFVSLTVSGLMNIYNKRVALVER